MPASDAVVLPETARPNKYRIKLHPDLTNFTFEGEQSVDIQVLEPTSSIVLNAIDLTIEKATIHAMGISLTTHSVNFDKNSETATLEFHDIIQPGEAR